MSTTAFEEPSLVPTQFFRALRTWLTAAPAIDVAPSLRAADRLLERLLSTTSEAVPERQLLRFANREVPMAHPDDAIGAEVVLDLWRAARAGGLRQA